MGSYPTLPASVLGSNVGLRRGFGDLYGVGFVLVLLFGFCECVDNNGMVGWWNALSCFPLNLFSIMMGLYREYGEYVSWAWDSGDGYIQCRLPFGGARLR